jgi:hypothetical protein
MNSSVISTINTQIFKALRPRISLASASMAFPDAICRTYSRLRFLSGCPATISSLAMVKNAPVSMVVSYPALSDQAVVASLG